MIFAVEDHIKQVIEGVKTQTRRSSGRYKLGRKYSIQPGRTQKGILEGKIIIIDKTLEVWPFVIRLDDAKAEGGYTPEEFEKLYRMMHPNWGERYAYTFRFVPRCMSRQ